MGSTRAKRGRTSSATRIPRSRSGIPPTDPLTRARTPRIRPRAEHPISRSRIDPDALKVLYRLRAAGYKAYLVGGSVRDLLLGRVAEGLRHRHRRAPAGAPQALPQLPPDRPALPAGPHPLRRRKGRRGRDLPRAGPSRVDPRRRRSCSDLGQHVRHAARGRAAARLHDQRPLLRHLRLLRHRLRRRPRRPRGRPHPHDRRPRRSGSARTPSA